MSLRKSRLKSNLPKTATLSSSHSTSDIADVADAAGGEAPDSGGALAVTDDMQESAAAPRRVGETASRTTISKRRLQRRRAVVP